MTGITVVLNASLKIEPLYFLRVNQTPLSFFHMIIFTGPCK